MGSAGAKSVMSNDMKELTEGKEQITSEIRGHKANLANPSECTPLALPVIAAASCSDQHTPKIQARNPRKTARRCSRTSEGTTPLRRTATSPSARMLPRICMALALRRAERAAEGLGSEFRFHACHRLGLG
jgi:hypothetical protein